MTRLQNIGSIFAKEGALTPVLGAIVEAAVAISGAEHRDAVGCELLNLVPEVAPRCEVHPSRRFIEEQ